MSNMVKYYALGILTGTISLDDTSVLEHVPVLYKNEVRDFVARCEIDDMSAINILKVDASNKLKCDYIVKRDATRWVNGYGFNCSAEDMQSFLASYILLSSEISNGASNTNSAILVKAYTEPGSYKKSSVNITYDEMTTIYKTIRDDQFAEYDKYLAAKAELVEIKTIKKLASFMGVDII